LSGHIVAIAREAGQSASFGAAILSAIFLGGVVAPVVAGAASDWLDSAKALLPFLVMPLIGLALLMAKANGVFLMAGSGMIGLGFAAWAGQMPLLITRYFGLRATGAIIGIICAAGGVFLGLGPVVLGFLRSASGNYHNALVMCLVLQAVAVALAALLGPFTAKLPKSPSYDLLDIAPLPGGGHS